MTPWSRRASSRVRRGDDGMALPTVLALVVVAALLATLVAGVSVATTGAASAGRAAAQAQAAAEGGIAAVRAKIAASPAVLSCSYAAPAGAGQSYVVEARFGPGVVGAPSCGPAPAGAVSPVPTSGASVLLVATGTAARRAQAGWSAGDRRRVEAVLSADAADGSTFDSAIFGGLDVGATQKLVVSRTAGEGSADVWVGQHFTCSSDMRVGGTLRVVGDARFSSTPCTVEGDVHVGGSFVCSAGTVVGGNLTVAGNATFSKICDIRGTVWVGGSVTFSDGKTRIGGDLVVRGSVVATEQLQVGGEIRVRGTVGGQGANQNRATYAGRLVENDTTVPAPPGPVARAFPVLSSSDSRWATWARPSWRTSVQPLRKPGSSMSVCQMSAGGQQFAAPLVVTTPSVFDTTLAAECGAGGFEVGAGLTIELRADAVLLVDGLKQNGDVTVRSGDGRKHALHVVHPAVATPSGGCPTPAPATQRPILMSSGTWTQDTSTSVLLYTPNVIDIRTSPSLRGQLYGCRDVVVSTSATVQHVPVSGSATALSSWVVSSVRDVPSR